MIDTSASREAMLSRIRGLRARTNPELAAKEYAEISRRVHPCWLVERGTAA